MTGQIREPRPDEYDRLRAIQQSVLEAPSPQLLGAAVDGPLFGLVRLVDGDIAGYVLAVVGDRRGYLPELAVTADRQRAGHGTALLDAIVRRLAAKGVETVRVTARADDERARSFYEKRGFDRLETVEEYYDDGGEGVVYRRSV